jgi:hypothetical protein
MVAAFLMMLWSVSAYAQMNSAASQIGADPGDGVIILGDVAFTISSDARFFARDERTPISFSSFKEGDWVEYSVNDQGEIDEMWLSSENK